MRNFEFHNPTKLVFGKDTIRQIGEEIRRRGHHYVLMIAGGGSIKRNGVYDAVVRSLNRAGIRWDECWGVQPNPVLSKVEEMVSAAKKAGVDAVLGVGGGSVLDSAKAVAAGYYVEEDVWSLFEKKEPVTRALPVYGVLTLSAAGSEMNGYAVITKADENKKWPIGGPALFPQVSIVDPSVQATLPWEQTVNGAIDTISHIQELYFPGRDAETTLALDESLMRTVVRVTDRLREDPGDYAARASLAWASTMALNGAAGAGLGDGDWATHAMEHGLSGVHPEVAHGTGLGVIFPAWILYCQEANPETFRRWARNVWGKDSVEQGVAAFRAKLAEWGAPTSLKQLGVAESEIDTIAETAYTSGMRGSLKQLSLDDFKRILRSAWDPA